MALSVTVLDLLVKCAACNTPFEVKSQDFKNWDLLSEMIRCPKCKRGYAFEDGQWYCDRPLIILKDLSKKIFETKSDEELVDGIFSRFNEIYDIFTELQERHPDLTAEEVHHKDGKNDIIKLDVADQFNYTQAFFLEKMEVIRTRYLQLIKFYKNPRIAILEFINGIDSQSPFKNMITYDELLYLFPDKKILDEVLDNLIYDEVLDVSRTSYPDKYKHFYEDAYPYFVVRRR